MTRDDIKQLDVRQIIRNEAKNREITISKLCRLAKIPKECIFRYLNNPEASMHSDRLVKILTFCGYKITKGK